MKRWEELSLTRKAFRFLLIGAGVGLAIQLLVAFMFWILLTL